MGFLSKLMFWSKKKQEEKDLELKEEQSPPIEYPSQDPSQFGRREQQQPMMPQQPMIESSDREFQVLSSKLDVLNAKLDAINQRLDNLERLASEEQKW